MIRADSVYLDGEFDVELLRDLIQQINGVNGEAIEFTLIGDVFEQPRHLSIARQLANQGTKALFHFHHLAFVRL